MTGCRAGTGNDTVIGGTGYDKLTGGEGADNFVFYSSFGKIRIMDDKARDSITIGSGANNIFRLEVTDTAAGLRTEFANAEVFFNGIDVGDLNLGNFDFI